MSSYYDLFINKKFSHSVTEICLIASTTNLGIERTGFMDWISLNMRVHFEIAGCSTKYFFSILPYIIAIIGCLLIILKSASTHSSSDDLSKLKNLLLRKKILKDLISKKDTLRRSNLFLAAIILPMSILLLPSSIRTIFLNPFAAYCHNELRDGTSYVFTSGIIVILFSTYGALLLGILSTHFFSRKK